MKTYRPEEIKQAQEDIGKYFEEAMKYGGLKRVLEIWHQRQNEWKSQKVNIAIIGQTGTGKSSFINAVFKKWTNKPGPANTGVTETTMKVVGYEHPNNPNIVLFDLPGVGTENFPRDNYLKEVDAEVYDVFIIMTATRFTEVDAWLGGELQKRKKAVVFVRTKIGIDVDNNKHDNPDMDEESVLSAVKESTIEECRKLEQRVEVFLIDNHCAEKYEFEDLENHIVKKLTDLKGEALVFSISNITKETLRQKIKELESRITRTAATGALLGTFPGAGIISDQWVVKDMAQHYKVQLGLEVESLEKRSIDREKVGKIKQKVNEVMADIPNLVRGCDVDSSYSSLAQNTALLACKAVPVFNTFISASTVSTSLHLILDKFAAIAVEAIDECDY